MSLSTKKNDDSLIQKSNVQSKKIKEYNEGGYKSNKSKKYKGGWFKQGIRIMGIPIEKSTPGLIDGRTCYKIGPLNWCSRKK